MRILSVNTYPYLRGGDSRYAFLAADGLRQRGHDLRSFAMDHPQALSGPDRRYFAPEIDYPQLLAQGGVGAGLKVLRSSVYNRDARNCLRAMLADYRPDVAHLHTVMHHLTASVVLELYEQQIPVVWTLHDYKAVCPATHLIREGRPCSDCRNGAFHNAIRHRCKRGSLGASVVAAAELYGHRMWRIYERASVLIAPSEFLAAQVQEMGLRHPRIEVLPNPVSSSQPRAATDAREPYLLFVGRLSAEKGLANLLRAIGRVDGARLRIAGTGEAEAELRERASGLPEGSVEFLGHLDGSQLVEEYRGATAVVVPSEWYENCPMVILEAGAQAVPVLATRIGGLPELVLDGEGGWLLPMADVDAWARAIAEALSDSEECRRRGERLRAHLAERHDEGRHFDRLEQLLATAAGN